MGCVGSILCWNETAASSHLERLPKIFESDCQRRDRDCHGAPCAVTASDCHAQCGQSSQLEVSDCRAEPAQRGVLVERGLMASDSTEYGAAQGGSGPLEHTGARGITQLCNLSQSGPRAVVMAIGGPHPRKSRIARDIDGVQLSARGQRCR